MLPHPSSPRKIRSVNTSFFNSLLSFWFFETSSFFLALFVWVHLYKHSLPEQTVWQLHIPISGLDVPVSPLYSDLKLCWTDVCVCLYFYCYSSYVGCATGLYMCLINNFSGGTRLILQLCNLYAEVGIRCVELSPFSPPLQGSAVLSHVSSSLLTPYAWRLTINAHVLLY